MNTITKYILGFIALSITFFFSWYFFTVIVYVLVAAVISFIGKPIIDLLGKIKVREYRLSDTVKAAITVVFLWFVFILFFSTIIPLVVHEFQSLENVSVNNIVAQLQEPVEKAGHFLKYYGIMEESEDVNAYISKELNDWINIARLRTWFGSLAGTVSDLFVALFSITFISFFFLKDSRLFSGMVLAIVPSKYEEQAKNALDSIQNLLVRYFVGLFFEVIGVMVLNVIGLSIVGLNFNNAVVIGLVTGILNVIPYIGPLIGVGRLHSLPIAFG